jgi:isopentenyl-diphosphate delta-isomerase
VNTTGSRSAEQGTGKVLRAKVSFGSEELILVDSDDREIGHCSKRETHAGQGRLHRAFSAFLFDDRGRVLLHQRSEAKPLWPGYWTNSCCSHPRRGESVEVAVRRRLYEELGVQAQIMPVYKFEYQASFGDVGSEHELCHVYLAQAEDPTTVSAHEDEIREWRWLPVAEVDRWVSEGPEALTPWFLMEWQMLRETHASAFDAFVESCTRGSHRGAA